MWLTDYIQKRWGLLCLVGGLTVTGLWVFGGTQSDDPSKPPGSGSAKASLKAKAPPKKKLTAASVTRYCTGRGVAANQPAQPRAKTVRHPGFPAPAKSPPTLGTKARGLFPLQRRLLGMGPHRLAHAPLIHRLAQGFAARYHYFRYLSENRRAARRYHQRQAERRRKKGQALAPTPGAVGATGKPTPPPSAIIALKARGYRRTSLGYYQTLMVARTLARYKARPRALLEYASLVMAPMPRTNPRRHLDRKTKRARTGEAARRRTAGLRLLHRLLQDHPTSPEAIEAMSLLAHQAAAAGQCPKVIFLLKNLSCAPLPPKTTGRQALLRGLAHYYAGRCLSKKGSQGAAAKRYALAAGDARRALTAGHKHGGPLAREATIGWARAYGASGETDHARDQLRRLGPKLHKIATGVLVAQLLKEGQLRVCMRLCAPPKTAPAGAK